MAARKKKSAPSESDLQPSRDINVLDEVETVKSALPFPVAGIGASAGGLDALKKFFTAMPPDSGVAFILIPHLDPSHRSLMVELLCRQTSMPVQEAAEGMAIEPNCVYIIPPNRYLAVQNGRMHLTESPARPVFPTVLNNCFHSLAEDQRDKAIGIILSGTGSHGLPGLKEIKAAGGMVMAQEPSTAEYDQMPQSAISTGLVDYIAAPEHLPGMLLRYLQQPYLRLSHSNAAAVEDFTQFDPVLDLLRIHGNYDFRNYRKKMLVRRILRRMGICQVDQVANYVTYLNAHVEEISALTKDLLIGVTSFFRDPDAFETLGQEVIAGLVRNQRGETPLRVWVVACATGEEAYSLAILLFEQFAAARKPPHFQIFASDIDGESLDVARIGNYDGISISQLSAERIQQFFVKSDEDHYHVTKQLRASVVVTRQNVISDAPFSKLDLISCRNLMIYLEPELQQKILALFHFALNERGYLFLGCSESVGRQIDLFEPVSKKWRIFRRISSAKRNFVQVPISSSNDRNPYFSSREQAPPTRMNVTELTQSLLVAKFAAAAVLVNRKYEVLSLVGRTSQFLELPTGEMTRDLMSLLRSGLRTKVRAACHKVLRGGEPTTSVEARVARGETTQVCSVSVSLLHEPPEAEGLLLIVFQDRTDEQFSHGVHKLTAEEESAVVRHLEHEVESTREDLQGTIEELNSSNEEVMSINEELQSANEELETSKEELQSFNEELSTVNSQLQEKVEESERANNDIRNLLNSTEIATVFLDPELRIRRYTPSIVQLLRLIPSDVGRPIRDLALLFTDEALLDDAPKVLETLIPMEVVVQNHAGRLFLRRILPYRAADNRIEGVVLTFIGLTDRMQADAQSRRLAGVLRDSNDAVMLLDLNGRITAWNRGATQLYGYSEGEALMLRLQDLVPPNHWREQEKMVQRITEGEVLKSFETRRTTKTGTALDIWSTVTLLTDDQGKPIAIATTDRDVTERKRIDHALAKSERRMRAIVETASDAIIAIDNMGIIETFNPAAERMFGYTRDEAIGQDIQILVPPSSPDEHDSFLALYSTLRRFHPIGVGHELIGKRIDGAFFPIDLSLSEMHDGPDPSFTCIIRDISERKTLQRELLTIASEEKRRISQDLHDSVGQKLTGLGMLAGSLAETLRERSPADAPAAIRIATGLENSLDELRKVSSGLLPVEVDAEGLRAALTELADVAARDTGVNCDFQCEDSVPVNNSETATHLYRIAQEAISNALKHAAPTHILISLTNEGTCISLSIRDDGTGFSHTAFQTLGMGLRTMQYRAALIGATLSIIPTGAHGTLVTCRVDQN